MTIPPDDGRDSELGIVPPPRTEGAERRIGLAKALAAAGVAKTDSTRMGRFEVRGTLGRGGMGVVYEARDPELDRLVAIKVLHRTNVTFGSRPSSEVRGDIIKEARALAKLAHPNVVGVYDIADEDSQLFVAMEHMPGGSLAHLLATNPPDDWVAVVRLFIDAGRGLAAAHDAGIVHRDFKPENVLIDGNGRAKVADFGLARIAPDAVSTAGPRSLVGTMAYMAPELFQGARARATSDQYAYSAAISIALRPYGERVPATIRSLLSRGMRDAPEDRWPSVSALVDALERRLDTKRDRHREALIDRVRRIWIDGVLEASLDGRAPITLPISRAHDLVDSPWERARMPPKTPSTDEVRTSDLPELFDESNGALLVVGGPGAGKTTAVLELARTLIDRAERDPSAPVPAVLNLASYRRKRNLHSWVVRELVAKYRLPRHRVAKWLESDEIALILDGLDELSSGQREPCIVAINEFLDEHPVAIVVACREPEYAASSTRLMLGDAVRIEPLQTTDVARWGLGDAEAAAIDERLRTPLWLTLAAQHPEVTESSWDQIYRRYVEDALDRAPAVPAEERTRWHRRLRWLASNMARRGDSDLWLETMQYSWFPSAGRQALAIAAGTLALAATFLIPSMLVLTLVGFSPLAGFVLGIGGIGILLAFNGGLRVRTGERVRWSLRLGLRRMPAMVAICLTIAVAYSILAQRPLASTVFAAATGGIVVGLQLGLEYSDQARGIRPYDGLRTALRQFGMIGLAGAVVTGLAYALVISPATAILFPEWIALSPPVNIRFLHSVPLGTIFGLTIGALYGGAAVILHTTHRLVLAATTPLPLRLVGWLDDATRRGLLRRIGGGYMFMHATLLRSLAETAKPENAQRNAA